MGLITESGGHGKRKKYRKKTNLTIRGIFLVGFLVSPAVMPRDSVPPSIKTSSETMLREKEIIPTCKTGRHEYLCKPSESTNKRCARNAPIFGSDCLVSGVETSVHKNAYEYENDDGYDFKRGDPVFWCV